MGLGNPALGIKVKEQFPNDHLAISTDKWFVAVNGATAASVADQLGLNKTQNILGIVVTVGGYNGLAPNNIWEWIKAKGSAVGG
jgi:hypothetical protein